VLLDIALFVYISYLSLY